MMLVRFQRIRKLLISLLESPLLTRSKTSEEPSQEIRTKPERNRPRRIEQKLEIRRNLSRLWGQLLEKLQ